MARRNRSKLKIFDESAIVDEVQKKAIANLRRAGEAFAAVIQQKLPRGERRRAHGKSKRVYGHAADRISVRLIDVNGEPRVRVLVPFPWGFHERGTIKHRKRPIVAQTLIAYESQIRDIIAGVE